MGERCLIPIDALDPRDMDLLGRVSEQLRNIWAAAPPEPRLLDQLPLASDRVWPRLMVELIKEDMDCRRKAAVPPVAVDQYLAECDLCDVSGAREELLAAAEGREDTSLAPFSGLGETAEWASSIAIPVAPLQEGHRLGHYRVVRPLGRGGMGWVYLAHDEELDRLVAVKIPHRSLFCSEEELRRFLDEARTAAKLIHAGVVPVYYFGREPDGTTYIVMEYIEGPSLAERLASGTIPPTQVMTLLASVADAVAYIHRKGFVHRDIKPRNILLDSESRPHVADFGLALHESTQRHLSGDSSGTLAYMPPEQIEGKTQWLDGRADVWALGVILYEMLTGRRPFQGDSYEELKQEILHREPKPPRQIDPAISVRLESICLKCLSKNLTGRFATAGDLSKALSQGQSSALLSSASVRGSESNECLALGSRSASGRLYLGRVGCAVSVVFSLFFAISAALLWHLGAEYLSAKREVALADRTKATERVAEESGNSQAEQRVPIANKEHRAAAEALASEKSSASIDTSLPFGGTTWDPASNGSWSGSNGNWSTPSNWNAADNGHVVLSDSGGTPAFESEKSSTSLSALTLSNMTWATASTGSLSTVANLTFNLACGDNLNGPVNLNTADTITFSGALNGGCLISPELNAPKNGDTMQHLAHALFHQNRDALGAYMMLKDAKAVDPIIPTPEATLGGYYEEDGDHRNAVVWMNKSLDAAPTDIRTHLFVAHWALKTKEMNLARKAADKALKLDPKSHEARELIERIKKEQPSAKN